MLDLLGGFSGPSDLEESDGESEDKEQSLDLLTAMLESSSKTKTKTKAKKKKGKPKDSASNKCAQRSKVPQHPSSEDSCTEMSEMKGKAGRECQTQTLCMIVIVTFQHLAAKMEAMQAELNSLRQQVSSQSSSRQQPPQPKKTSGAPSNKSPGTKTVNGERVRVAHQPAPGEWGPWVCECINWVVCRSLSFS